MKKSSVFFIVLFAISPLMAQHRPQKLPPPKTLPVVNQDEEKMRKRNGEIVVFDQYEFERQAIPYGSDGTFVFTFKNKGRVPVIFNDVQTSCGCTTAEKPEKPIRPGKKGRLVVSYDTKKTGAFQKEITILTNVQPEPITLIIKGSVLPEGINNPESK